MSLKDTIDFSKLQQFGLFYGEDEEDTRLLKDQHKEATDYLLSHDWCTEIIESYIGIGVGGIVAVFLFEIRPNTPEADEFLWVITGDIPSLYLTVEDCPNPACALDGYIGILEEWAEAAIHKKMVGELPPISTLATTDNGLMLKKRLEFLDKEVLNQFCADLIGVSPEEE